MSMRTGEVPSELPAISWRPWIIAAILALLFHLFFLFTKIPGFFLSPPAAPPRVDIKQVDPRKLDEIRRQWRKREQQLLLDKGIKTPTAPEAPPDARYMSDRNMRVEQERKARQSTVIPKPGAPGEPAAPAQPPQTRARKLPDLGNLGVPLPAAPKRLATPPRPARRHGGQEGGAQALADDLPEGSENLLNAQESVYYSFYARLYEAIGPVWQSKIRSAARMRRLQPGEYTTTIDVVFDRNGNLVGVRQLSGSGIEEFDRAAASSWKSIGRFPNPPSGLLDDEGRVHTGWTFTVLLNQGMNLESLPPEQMY